jgi:hypothetical protein
MRGGFWLREVECFGESNDAEVAEFTSAAATCQDAI